MYNTWMNFVYEDFKEAKVASLKATECYGYLVQHSIKNCIMKGQVFKENLLKNVSRTYLKVPLLNS